jgi:hypothetical protein
VLVSQRLVTLFVTEVWSPYSKLTLQETYRANLKSLPVTRPKPFYSQGQPQGSRTITMTHKHHRLFDIPEILREIFLGLAEPDCWGRCLTSADLARAARCSKKFSAPALDALWQTMHSELPLFKLLPGFQEVDDIWVRHISLHILPAMLITCSPYRFYPNLNQFVILTGKDSMDMRGALDTYG